MDAKQHDINQLLVHALEELAQDAEIIPDN